MRGTENKTVTCEPESVVKACFLLDAMWRELTNRPEQQAKVEGGLRV
jgi:hypothetical protein